jgi:autoinducer 2 (AI-2) kinase
MSFLTIDAGTGAIRCMIFDSSGNVISSSYREWAYRPTPEVASGFEFDPNDFWSKICLCIKETISKGKVSSSQINGVGVTSMRHGTVFLAENGKEILACPNIDARGLNEAFELEKILGEKIYQITGKWPSPTFAPSRILWMKRHKPEKFKEIRKILTISDWIIYKLSGRFVAEPSNASSTMLLNCLKLTWYDELINYLGLEADSLPELHSSAECIGEVTQKVANLTGLKKGTPIVTAGADTQAALIGTGAIEEKDITVVAGTTSPVQLVLSKPIIDENFRTWTEVHIMPNRWILESNAGPTGTYYRWFRDNFCELEKIVAKLIRVDDYEIMDKECEFIPPGANDLIAVLSFVMNAHKSSRRPKGAIIGFKPTSDKREIMRAILENISYAIFGNCQQLEEVSGIKVEKLNACGGASKSNIWITTLANVLGKPVSVFRVKEATSLGAAICVAAGLKVYKNISEGVKSMVKQETEISPEPIIHEYYKDKYKVWKSLHDLLWKLAEDGIISTYWK